jgi:hypothetical protein
MKGYDSSKYKAWYAVNGYKKRAYALKYYASHRAEKIAYAKAKRAANPREWVKSHLKRLYGTDIETIEKLISAQGNKCAICKITFDREKKALKPQIDHDHRTGMIRGILCSGCNVALGHLEKPGFLNTALKYLGEK